MQNIWLRGDKCQIQNKSDRENHSNNNSNNNSKNKKNTESKTKIIIKTWIGKLKTILIMIITIIDKHNQKLISILENKNT